MRDYSPKKDTMNSEMDDYRNDSTILLLFHPAATLIFPG